MLVKNIKSKLATVLAAAMIMSSLSSVPASAAGYDTTAPEMISLTIDNTTYNVGDSINFNMAVVEEETGVTECTISFTSIRNVRRNITLIGNGWTDNYTAEYIIDEDLPAGEYVIDFIKITDAAGNTNMQLIDGAKFTVVNDKDTVGPLIDQAWSNIREVDVTENDSVQKFICHTDDQDIAKISIEYYSGNISRTVDVDIEEISEDGYYYIDLPQYTTDPAGKWDLGKLVTTDINGNTSTTYAYYAWEVISNVSSDEEKDTETTTIDSIDFDSDSIVIPSAINLNISGTTTSNEVSGTVVVVNTATNEEISATLSGEVVDGNYTASANIAVSNQHTAGEYMVNCIILNDKYYGFTKDNTKVFTATNEIEDLYLHTSLTNPALVDTINEAPEGSTILLTPNGTDKIPAEVFKAIDEHNKTIMVDLDGIKWIFNGNDIEAENIKDIDFSTGVEETNLEQYGYPEDAEGVAITFAPNGILPGKANIMIKSDYISNKFNLNSKLFLAFIKETADDEAELEQPVETPTEEAPTEEETTDNTEVSTDTTQSNYVIESEITDEDIAHIDSINADSEKLVRIEDAGITMDQDGYVTVTMYHNSSYVLSDKLPTVKTSSTNSVEEDKPQKQDTVSTDTTPSNTVEEDKPQKQDTESTEEVQPQKTPTKKFKISKISIKRYKTSINVSCKASGAKGYQIKYGTNKKKLKTITIKNTKSKTIKKLKRHKKYYVYIRAYKVVNMEKVYTSWKKYTIKTR